MLKNAYLLAKLGGDTAENELPPQRDADMRHLLRALSGEEKLTSSAS